MAVIKRVVGQITLSRIVDVVSTTYFYLLMPSIAAAPSKPTVSPPPTYETEGYSGWSETEPGYVSGDTRSLYVTVRTIYGDGSFDYTTPSLSSSYEAAKQAYNRAQSALSLADGINNYFWWLTSSTDSDIPTGAYVTNIPKTSFETNKTGGNIVIQSTGITIRNGIDTLASLSGQALNFYETNNGYLTMSLNENSLNFYNPTNNNNDISAQLNANGLVLKKGGIESGNVTSGNGYVYLSTEDKSGITINGHTPGTNDPAWRQIIGTKFGVDADGTLYASGAKISGEVNITAGNVYTRDESDNRFENNLYIDTTYSGSNIIFTAKVILKGIDVTSQYLDGDFGWFYRTPTGDVSMNKNGKTITIPQASQEYGRTIVCVFTRNQYASLLTNTGNKLRISTGAYLIGRTEY